MNEIRTSCAPTDQTISSWESIDWTKCELEVRKLQARIVKAQKEGRYGKVKALQWLLTHSLFCASRNSIPDNSGESPAMATDPLVRG